MTRPATLGDASGSASGLRFRNDALVVAPRMMDPAHMIRLSAHLGFLWADRPLPERISAAAAAGFAAVELHWPHREPVRPISDALQRHDVQLLCINTPVGSRPGDFGLAALPGREDEFRAGFEDTLRYAVAAGASAIHVMAGVVPAQARHVSEATLLANLRRVAPEAAAAGLRLLLEPINRRDWPGYFYDNVAHVARIITQAGEPNLALLFDFYHAAVTEADPLASFAAHLDLIGHVQIAASPSRAEPDEGDLDYHTVFRQIAALGYGGWIGCEYRPRGETTAGLMWREALLRDLTWR